MTRRRFGDALQAPAGADCANSIVKRPARRSRRNCWRNSSLDIGFIINHKNEKVHERSPDLAMVAAPRGKIILNSVNSPGCVSTSIDPPCCLTMMS